MNIPKLSIVTPSFNQGHFLEETILSVLNQNYPNLEYIVIDGGSADNSVEIIKKYSSHITYWVSERDRGQVEALNKGLARATGDLFAFINSDDVYLPGAFKAVFDHFNEHPDCRWVCGDTMMFGEGHKTELFRATVPTSVAHALSWEAHCPQPGMFWRREIVESGFSEQWPYDFDHELYIRLLLAGHKCDYLPTPLAAYRLHKVSKTVAEGHRQMAEFDLLSERYEEALVGSDRRWCRGIRFIRSANKSLDEKNRPAALRFYLRALYSYPEGLRKRSYWGTLRKIINEASPLKI